MSEDDFDKLAIMAACAGTLEEAKAHKTKKGKYEITVFDLERIQKARDKREKRRLKYMEDEEDDSGRIYLT